MKKIAILGTRGIPASYSGFETSVEETSIRFVEQGYQVTVFCRSNHYEQKASSYKGVKLKFFPSIKSKHLDTVTNTLFSVVDFTKSTYDVLILYGIGNAYFLPIFKLFCKNIISVVDGADWERAKWGALAKFVLEKYLLKKGRYIIFIGRFVKEKGIEFLLENYSKLDTDLKLVVVGGNVTDKEYVDKLKSTKDERIIFPGFVYGKEYESLLKYAKFYVSCSFLEGTSPSLLSAMAINGFALVSDLPQNIEVLKGTCKTFQTGVSEDFRSKFVSLLKEADIDLERIKTLEVIKKYYTWDRITNQYIDLFNTMMAK